MRVVPVHACRLDQAHEGRRSLTRVQATGKQPVVATNGIRPDVVLDPVVVHGELPVTHEPGQLIPAPQAVAQRSGRR